jgi:hypothetical protein
MRAFVRLREIIGSNKGLTRRLAELEKKYDAQKISQPAARHSCLGLGSQLSSFDVVPAIM